MRLYFAIAGFALMAFMAKAEVPSGVVEKMLALEAEAVSGLSKSRVKALLRLSVTAPAFLHSKKWLVQQPPATGDEQWACLAEAIYLLICHSVFFYYLLTDTQAWFLCLE